MNDHLKVLLLSSYVWFFGEGLLGPLYALFVQSIGGDILELTAAYSLYMIAMGICSIYVGNVSDHRSMEHMMMAGYVLNAAGTFGYLFVDSPARLFLVQLVLGCASALATPTWNSLFSIHLDRKRVGYAWGLSEGGPKIIIGMAILLGGLIVTRFGFAVLFLAMGTIQVMAALIQAYIFRLSES